MRFRPGQHLRRQADIRGVREQGRRLDCRAFTVWWRPNAAGSLRACVIASTAAVGCAVQRNRAKRRLRELFRLHQDLLPAPCDLLLIARASVNTWDFDRLEDTFAGACGQIRRDNPSHA